MKQNILPTCLAPVRRKVIDLRQDAAGAAATTGFAAAPLLPAGAAFDTDQSLNIHDVTAREQQKRELDIQRETIDKDLQVAHKIQMSLLPDPSIDLPRIQTAWQFEPCQLVGGDIFQIYAHRPEEVRVYVLDVCGHGVSAALVAVSVYQFVHSLHNRMRLTGRVFSPRAVIDRLEEAFPLDRFNCFFTIVYATLNVHTGQLVYANAGHEPPLILRADGRLETLEHHGTVIGAGFDSTSGQDQRRLVSGDRLIHYTDGLLDNFGPNGEREGRRLFHATLRELSAQPLDRLLAGILGRANKLRGPKPPADDMSMLAIACGD